MIVPGDLIQGDCLCIGRWRTPHVSERHAPGAPRSQSDAGLDPDERQFARFGRGERWTVALLHRNRFEAHDEAELEDYIIRTTMLLYSQSVRHLA